MFHLSLYIPENSILDGEQCSGDDACVALALATTIKQHFPVLYSPSPHDKQPKSFILMTMCEKNVPLFHLWLYFPLPEGMRLNSVSLSSLFPAVVEKLWDSNRLRYD